MGKENGGSRNPPSRHSKSLRMERGFFSINDNQANRSQSFSAAAARGVRPIPLHPSPAELERRHSQNVRRRHTGLFGSRPAVKVPRVESALNMFTKLQAGLSECATYLQEALNSVEPKRKRLVEQRIRLLESRLHEMEELFQLYMYQQKIREGSKNLIHALGQQGSKDGLDKCKSSYKECTERLCALEEELESKLGIFRIKIEGLAGFGRLCSGDTYDVLIKHGSSFKWKARCKIDKDGQRWIDSEFPLLPRINDELSIRVVEMRKIQANLSVGNIILRSRTYIKARPQTFSVPLNSTGSMKLKLTVEWRPFSGTAENTIRSKRPQSLLSEVIFVPGGENNDAMSISTSPAHSQGSNKNLQSNNSLNDSEDGQRKYTPERAHHIAIIADSPPVFERDYILGNGISEEPEEFRHATSLDRAVMHLIPTFQSHKDQYPELQLMIKQLEKLEEILKKCSLSRSSISISVESALESFDFLEDNEDEVESSARSVKSDGSWHQDTGYNSTDDFGRDSGEEGCAKSPLKLPQFTPDTIVEASESNSSTEIIETCFGKEEFEISYKFRKREDKDETNKESGKSDQDKGDVGSKEDEAQGVAMEDLEALGATGNRGSINDGVGRSRPISPNLSSSDSQDVTVGNKALDKVILAHLQLCEELTGFLGSFGPMKFKETIALAKLRRQARVLELLLDLAIHNDNEEITLERACPGLFSNVLVCSIWQNSIRASPLYVLAKDVRESFEERFNSQIKQSYNRVADSVFPTIIGRIIHQDGDIIEPIVEDDEVISVYQYENFLLEHSRHNTTKYVDEVAYELLISRRLLSTEKEAVVAQLKQYSEVPLTRICFCAVLSLLVDTDRHLVQAAESFLCSLIKDSEARRKAVTLATEALEESDDRLREGACLALTVLQVKDCIAQLRYLSRCDVPNVKIAAKKALSSFGESEDSSRGEPFSSNAGLEGLLY
ncbi:rho family-interacting cell polarization regulator 1-like isoform X2 [Actinia tenebrosa]|uniref:Rho family-interacting cell polarization regulator 1-like isoform X2 n=1 Tax=Actinia tenebrosa TaxID=6105 RepID=A0A6P8IQL4_ACTTE|nr:rho family-interacting cell polarization regulator 1-like isoform X2 [Actinia tenebrosa]